VDDEDRENEGDLTLAAEKVTPEAINFMAKYGRGLVCLTMTEERLDHLRIRPMSAENTSNYGTAFCEAIDARQGVTTGIPPTTAPTRLKWQLIRPRGHPIWPARTCVSPAGEERWSSGPRRTNGSLGGPSPHGRTCTCGDYLRNHAR